jgi:hypothetical protein
MTYLEDLKGKHVEVNGVPLPDRKTLKITAAGATASDSPAQESTLITLPGASTTAIPVDIAVPSSKSITEADWGGRDPATVPLRLFVSAAATVTLPTDASLVAGCTIEIIKQTDSNYSVTIDPDGSEIQETSMGNPTTSPLSVGTSFKWSARWTYSGDCWQTPFFPRKDRWVNPTQIETDGYSLVGKSNAGEGPAERVAIADGEIAGRIGTTLGGHAPNDFEFASSDGTFVLSAVAPSPASYEALSGTTTSHEHVLPTPTNSRIHRVTWTVTFVDAGGNVTAMEYFAKYLRNTSGTLSILEERWLTDTAQVAVPTDITVAASVAIGTGGVEAGLLVSYAGTAALGVGTSYSSLAESY